MHFTVGLVPQHSQVPSKDICS